MADLRLEFGVLGGNKLAGESGHNILNDLQTICSNISRSKLLKVSVHLDNKTKFGGLTEEIQKSIKSDNLKLNTEKIKLKFGIDAKYLDDQLKQHYKNYKPPATESGGGSSNKSSKQKEKKSSTNAKSLVTQYTAAYREQLKLTRDLTKAQSSGASKATTDAISAQIKLYKDKKDAIKANIDALEDEAQRSAALEGIEKSKIELLGKHKIAVAQLAEAEAKRAAKQAENNNDSLLKETLSELNMVYGLRDSVSRAGSGDTADQLKIQLDAHNQILANLRTRINLITDATERERLQKAVLDEENKLIEKNNLAQARRQDETKRQQGLLEVYKDAASYVDKFGESIKEKTPGLFSEFSNLLKELKSGKFSGNPDDASKFLELLKQRAKEADAEVENLGDKIKSVFSDKYMYGLIALLASKGTEMFRKLLDNVIEIDTAMTELKKVTSETDATYERFLDKACDRSKELGALVSDVVTATADFARLGYGISDASTLADAAIVYKNVGDGITDISTASESIISTMQAFGIEASAVMSIVDRFNEVGNNFSITSKGIGDALVRSASALSAAGNTIDESIALVTAANRVAQDPIKVGTAMKSLSMYLRAAKTELEDAGEDTDGMASSVSELRDEILALTGQKVDIQIDANTFKSTTQIIRELYQVWDSLTDVSQANILELIGGKRNSNVIVALIENFEQVEEIIESSSKSAGSALKENEAVLDSINGKINVLKASIQELSTAALNSELVKFGVDSLTSLVDLVNAFEGTSSVLPWIALLGVFASNPFKEAAKSSATLFGTIKTMFTKSGVLGKLLLFVEGVSLLVTLLDMIPGIDIEGWFKKWTSSAAEKISDVNSEIEDISGAMKDTVAQSKDLAEAYEDVIPRFLKLYERAGSYGSQGDLSDSEYADFLSLQNQIAEILPQVDAGLDSNGNHMLALSGNTEEAAKKLEEYYNIQQKILALEGKKQYDEVHTKYFENKANYDNAIKELQEERVALDAVYQKILNGDTSNFKAKGTDGRTLTKLGIKYFADRGRNFLSLGDFNLEDVEREYIREVDALTTRIETYTREKASSENQLGNLFSSLLQTDLAYQTLDTQTQEVINDIVGNLDPAVVFEKAGGSSSDVVTQYFYDNYIAPMMDMGIGDTIAQYLSGELSLDDALGVLQNSFSDINEDLKTDFIASMQKSGHNVNTLEDAIEALLIDLNKLPSDTEVNITTDISDIEAALEETKTEFEKINDIASKVVVSGVSGLNAEEYQKLAETLPGVRSAYEEYIAKVKSGTATESDQNQVLKTITASAKRLQEVELAKTVANIADAFEDYGKDSIEVQDAMRDLEKVAPEVAAALWDEEAAMYDLSKATGSTAEDMRAFLASVIGANFAPLIAELSALEQEYYRVGSAALWAAAAQGAGPYRGKKKGEVGPDDQANLDEYKEGYVRDFTEDFQKEFQSLLTSIPTGGGGGGGSSQTEVEKLKDLYDEYAASLEYQISLQEQYFQDGAEALDSDRMREALIRQVGYYREIQRQAEASLEAVKNYYRGKGMSDNEIEQQDEVQDLSKAWLEASQDVSDAMERMTKDIAAAFSASVDEMQGVYDTLHSAADEYAETGYITVDTLQAIISHGVEYMALLQDENGQLVINEQKIKDIIAARTEQMAIESALAYIEALRTAKIMGNTAEMERLLFATQQATDASWGFVYANLALLALEGDHYNAALKNINALRALAKSASESIGNSGKNVGESLKDMQSGLNDILDYVMDMIKDETDAQIEAIEDQKDAFSEYIEMRKEALDTAREETDYEEQKADLLKQIAKIQSNIDMLELVGTREAEAQKAALLEEQYELQKELADLQSEYAYDTQIDALDKMDEAYADSKDEEITKLEETISSEQKLYDLAISRIESQWNTLYDQLIEWNVRQGSSLNSEITESWNQALAAVQKYDSFVSAMDNIQADIDAVGTSGNINLGNTMYDDSYTDQDAIKAIVNKMKANSYNWFAYSQQGREDAAAENRQLGAQLAQYGVDAMIGDDGVWYIDRIGGQRLYDVYHTGGIVGGGSIKQNEQYALLEKGEAVLTEKKLNKLGEHFKVLGRLGDMMATFATSLSSSLSSGFSRLTDITSNVSNVTNDNRDNRKVEITFGDTYITGANEATIRKHQEINKGFMDELARQLGVKW